MSETRNLGQVAGVYIGTTAPINENLIWYDTAQKLHKVYDVNLSQWVILNKSVITTITYSALIALCNAQSITVGEWFFISDSTYDTLALAITKSKIQYCDLNKNIVIDDLGKDKQYYVNVSNIVIDDCPASFINNKAQFSFTEMTSANENPDKEYLFGIQKNTSTNTLIKYKISYFVELLSDLLWLNNKFYTSFKDKITNLLNKIGGIVGYDKYVLDLQNINTSIANIANNFNISSYIRTIFSRKKSVISSGKTLLQAIQILDGNQDADFVFEDIIQNVSDFTNILADSNYTNKSLLIKKGTYDLSSLSLPITFPASLELVIAEPGTQFNLNLSCLKLNTVFTTNNLKCKFYNLNVVVSYIGQGSASTNVASYDQNIFYAMNNLYFCSGKYNSYNILSSHTTTGLKTLNVSVFNQCENLHSCESNIFAAVETYSQKFMFLSFLSCKDIYQCKDNFQVGQIVVTTHDGDHSTSVNNYSCYAGCIGVFFSTMYSSVGNRGMLHCIFHTVFNYDGQIGGYSSYSTYAGSTSDQEITNTPDGGWNRLI